ncbi:MAG: outer membrane lipoprotein-sorting protein [Spirochaetaceae bacterium]|nr:MAG: outer membrane lipoprotein-sorting protein [Spirochaetaceae bacterium]
MKPTYMLTALMLAVAAAAFAQDPSGDEIIRRMEDNQTFSSAYMEGRMIIADRFGERTVTFEMYAEGEERFLIEFTSRDEQGQRILRREDNLYLYYPDAREVIRIQGAALRDSLFGSDLSYEDMTGGRGILDDYTAERIGRSTVRGRDVWEVRLDARTTNVPYPQQIYFVDVDDYVLIESHQFARNGRKLKETEMLEIREQDGYRFPAHMRITDVTRRSSGTEMVFDRIDTGISIPASTFSLEELSW